MLLTEQTAAGKQFLDLQLTNLYYCLEQRVHRVLQRRSSCNFTEEVIIRLSCRGTFIFSVSVLLDFLKLLFLRLGSHGKAD